MILLFCKQGCNNQISELPYNSVNKNVRYDQILLICKQYCQDMMVSNFFTVSIS